MGWFLADASAGKARLRALHIRVGLVLSVPLWVLGLTGAALTWEQEIEHGGAVAFMQSGQGRVPDVEGGASPERAEAAVSAALAELARAGRAENVKLSSLTAPEAPDMPYAVAFKDKQSKKPWEEAARLYVTPDASRAALTEEGELYRFLMGYHMHMGIPGAPGRNLVGFLGCLLLFSLISGPVLRLTSSVRRRDKWAPPLTKGTKASRARSLHGAAGLYCCVPIGFAALTGVYMAWPDLARPLTQALFPGTRDLRAEAAALKISSDSGKELPTVGVGAVLKAASEAAPAWEWKSVRFPMRPGEPYKVTLRDPGAAFPSVPMTVFVHPYNGAVMKTQDPREFSLGEKLPFWIHTLHGGRGSGQGWLQAAFTFAGAALTLFPLTGVYLWRKRRKKGAGG